MKCQSVWVCWYPSRNCDCKRPDGSPILQMRIMTSEAASSALLPLPWLSSLRGV